jgi:hypothetical protein
MSDELADTISQVVRLLEDARRPEPEPESCTVTCEHGVTVTVRPKDGAR